MVGPRSHIPRKGREFDPIIAVIVAAVVVIAVIYSISHA